MDDFQMFLDVKPGTSCDTDSENILADNSLTQKFLKGEISFTEYSNEWFKKDNIDDEDDEQVKKLIQASSRPFIPRRSKYKLPAFLVGLMGEANLRFVRGEKDIAEKMCYEIIRQMPTATEPYQTLAQIYDESDPEKALQFALLAAHLGPADSHEWLRLAAISHERNDPKQEMLCYTQAIKADPHNLECHLKRLDLLTKLEDMGFPVATLKLTRIKCYHKIVTSLDASESENIMKYMKLASVIYHKNGEIERALEVMMAAYSKCSTHFQLDDTNLFLELLIAEKKYKFCIDVFVAKLEVVIEAEIQTVCNNGTIEEYTHYLNCHMPHDFPVDLKCKLIVCFAHLNARTLVNTLIDNFIKHDVDSAGDLFMDIEESLTCNKEYELALKVLTPLVHSQSFNLGAVWLKHADCLYNLGKFEDAVISYKKVLEHAPQHAEAREKLFLIMESMNKVDDALAVLHQDYNLVVTAKPLYDLLGALKKYNRMEKYLEVGEALLSKSFFNFQNKEELKLALLTRNAAEAIYQHRKVRGQKMYTDKDLQFSEDETFTLSSEQEWSLFMELLNLAMAQKKYYIMQRLSYASLGSKKLNNYRSRIIFICAQTSILNKDIDSAINLIKEYPRKYLTNRAWNYLNFFALAADYFNYSKFVLRFPFNRDDMKKFVLSCNSAANTRYADALKGLLVLQHEWESPMISILIALCILFSGQQRRCGAYQSYLLKAISYMMLYQKQRRYDHEAYYNLGKTFQFLSLNNLAIEYYEKALNCPPLPPCELHGSFDYTSTIAWNLVVLYKQNSPDMARYYINKYLVI